MRHGRNRCGEPNAAIHRHFLLILEGRQITSALDLGVKLDLRFGIYGISLRSRKPVLGAIVFFLGGGMPAFLSHSSKDKGFVQKVASELSPLEYEFDEATFEYTLNVRAIRNALARSDLAVFFLSKNSVGSTFVAEEQRQALEALGRGTLKKVAVFALDETSYSSLPDWLREINVAQKVSNYKAVARRIQAMLIEIDLIDEPEMLYLGRDEDEKSIRKALRAPGDQTPIALHIVGFHGIGRRTFLKNTLTKLFPRFYSAFIMETVSANQSAEDVYRAVYRLNKVTSVNDRVEDFIRFRDKDFSEQISEIGDIVREMCENGEMLVVFDEGNGVLDDGGELFPHWKKLIEYLEPLRRPAIAFIQTRMQPYVMRHKLSSTYHQKIEALDSESAKEIISFSLKQKSIEFSEDNVAELAELAGGHPFNIRFAVGLAQHYGVSTFLREPSSFIAWRDKRGEDFIREIKFDSLEEDIIAYLIDYRYLAIDAIMGLVDADVVETSEALRNLQDFCCVELRDGMFHLAAPIRESARRDNRFLRDDDWRREVANKITREVALYHEDDQVPLNLLETATMAAIRGDGSPEYIRALVLPSHLLLIAREHYDGRRREQCIIFAKQAYELKANMTIDAQIEALRLWALAAARLKNKVEYDAALKLLKNKGSRSSTRVAAFVEGFKARLDGRDDDAEKLFLQAHDISKTNASINRELAKLYSNQRDFIEAEKYARLAYSVAPTNPFVLDILLEISYGKMARGLHVDAEEVFALERALETHGNEPGISFFTVREAQRHLNNREYGKSVAAANDAIALTPDLPSPYFIKLEAQTRSGTSLSQADATLSELKKLLTRIGMSEGEQSKITEAEANIQIERMQFDLAKKTIDDARSLPTRVKQRLYETLARAIAYDAGNASLNLIAWAKQQAKA